MKLLTLLLLLALAPTRLFAQAVPQGVILGDKAYVPQATETVCAARVGAIVPNPLGHFVLIANQATLLSATDPLRTMPAGGGKLLLWNSVTRQTKTVWQLPASEDESYRVLFANIRWLPHTNKALVIADQVPISLPPGQTGPAPHRYTLVWVDAIAGTSRTLTSGPAALSLHVSGMGATWVRIQSDTPESHAVTENGSLGPVLTTAPAEENATADAPKLPLRLQVSTAMATLTQTTRALHPLWLAVEESAASPLPLLIASDAGRGVLLPDLSAVLYVGGETVGAGLYAVPLRSIRRDQFSQAQAAARRQKSLSNAYQIAQALLAYAAQNGGAMPSGSPATALAPFFNGSDPFGDPDSGPLILTLALNGGKTLGTITGPNGTIIINGDGGVSLQ